MSGQEPNDQQEVEPTPQELAVLQAMLEHDTMEGAAIALSMSRHTVDAYLDRLRKKSGKHHLRQIVHWADEHNWWRKKGKER